MKISAKKQFLTDVKGRRTGVVLDLKTYEHLLEAEEQLADISAYDKIRDRVHSEVISGKFITLESYRIRRVNRKS